MITNPDMLHVGILPHHASWGDLFANLAFVVIDEAHVYRGVFGSHVANVLRRLRRAAAIYGTTPRFLLDERDDRQPGRARTEAHRPADINLIDNDDAPQPRRHIAIWNPPLLDEALGTRASALAEAAELLAELISAGARTICFMKSRKGVELILRMTSDRLPPELAERIAPYRGRLHARSSATRSRRAWSAASCSASSRPTRWSSGSTSASSTRRSASPSPARSRACARCGAAPAAAAAAWRSTSPARTRSTSSSPAIPRSSCARPVEAAIIDPDSPEIRAEHLLCAAHEAPLTEADAQFFGADVLDVARRLAEAGCCASARPASCPRRADDYPAARVALRSASADSFALIDAHAQARSSARSRRLAPTQPSTRARSTCTWGAPTWSSSSICDARRAILEPFDGNYFTQTKSESMTFIERMLESREHARRDALLRRGRLLGDGARLPAQAPPGPQRDRLPVGLDMPTTEFSTRALWYELDGMIPGPGPLTGTQLRAIGGPGGNPAPEPFPPEQLLGALHALEHGQIAVLPLIAMCDRWDIGGLSTNAHPQTGGPTIFIYDGHPGGIGITRRGYEPFDRLVVDANRLIGECPCKDGCPSCVQSPKCGNLNDPLSKPGALELLRRMRA